MQTPMNKPKVYLDTSAISYLDQTDAPEQMKITRMFGKHLSPENMTFIYLML